MRKLLFLTAVLLSLSNAGAQEKNAVASPSWIKEAVVYEVSLRNFSEDSKFFTLENRLAKIKSSGVDAVCLAPIFAVREATSAVPADVRAVKDFSAFNYEFGTKDGFKSLVQQAHYLGLKVLITWVDTTSRDHAWAKNKPEWYVKNSSGEIADVPGHTHLAVLEFSHPGLQEELAKSMARWITEYEIDGMKSESMGSINLEFWAKARKLLKAAKRDFVLLTDQNLPEAHLDAFDVSPSVQTNEFLRKIVAGEEKADAFERLLKEEESLFPVGALRARYSHETFGPAQKAAAVFNASIPGIAWLIAGEEIGEPQSAGQNEKSAINWKKGDKDLSKFYKTLLKLRRVHPALSRGQVFTTKSHSNEGEDRLLAYARTYRDDAVLVVINFSSQKWTGTLDVPDIFKSDKGGMNLRPALSSDGFSGSVLSLPAYGCQIFTAK